MRNTRKRLRWAAVVLAAVAATPAWAAPVLYQQDFFTRLAGVDRYGCLDWSCGTNAVFNTVINAKNGYFVGTSRACVKNKSCQYQYYCNVGCIFGYQLTLSQSLYLVQKDGTAFFTGSGCVFNQPQS